MWKVATMLRDLLIDHLAAHEALTTDLPAGATLVHVGNASRFRPDDEAFILSPTLNIGQPVEIKEIPEWNTIILKAPVPTAWSTSQGAYILKAISHLPIKRISIGDLRIMPSFPYVTVTPNDNPNEWAAMRLLDETYNFTVRAYVQTDNFEKSEIAIMKLGQQIKDILVDHIHPVLPDSEHQVLIADAPLGATVITVADTSKCTAGYRLVIRDAKTRPNAEEAVIRRVLSPTDLLIEVPLEYDYTVERQAEIYVMDRYLYDTRATDVSYGYVPGNGGSLLRAAEIKWFAKEAFIRTGNVLT